jgi:hypothetical protein
MLLISALILIFKDDIKAYALTEANKYLNKKVHIGYIDVGIWSSFPDMSLQFDDVLVYSKFDTLQTADTAFFSKRLVLKFSPLDFWESNYNIDEIAISEGVLNLKVLQNGEVNYDFLKQNDTSTSSPFSFELKQINIEDTRFSYINEATEQDYRANFNEMLLAGSFNQDQFTMDATTHFLVTSITNKSLTLITDKQASCDLSIAMDQLNNIFQIKNADLTINQLPFHIEGKVTKDSLDFSIGSKNLDLVEVAHNFKLAQLDVVNTLNGKGNVDFDINIEGPLSTTAPTAIDAKFSIANGALSDDGFSLSDISLTGSYTNGVKTAKELLYIPKLTFNTLNRSFTGDIKVMDFDRPRLLGSANGIIDLNAVYRLFGPMEFTSLSGNLNVNGEFDLRMKTPSNVLNELEIYNLGINLEVENIVAQFNDDQRVFKFPSGEIAIRNQQAGFKDLALRVGASDIAIDGTFNRIADYFKNEGELLVDANVTSENLVLEDLSSNEQNQANYRSWLLPSAIQGKLNLELKKVTYSGHSYERIKTQMQFGEHQLRFPYLSGISAGAELEGSLTISESKPMLIEVRSQLSSSKVGFSPLFAEWNNFEQNVIKAKNIKGDANINLSFYGPFDLYENTYDKTKFEATVDIKIRNGALVNVSSMKLITESMQESAVKLLLKKSTVNAFEKKLLNLNFDTFENRLSIKEGIITIPSMTIRSNALDITLSGTHTFNNEVNYSFSFRFRELKGEQTSEFGEIVDDGTGIKIFLNMTGTVEAPIFAWDKDAQQKQRIQERESAKEDLKSALKTGFGINKKDTTIEEIGPAVHREEKLIMDFDRDSLQEEFSEEEKKKKKSALQQQIDKWKKQNVESKSKEIFEIDD